jgi:glycosyltransferase involved in cell wall biosynthesis
MIKFSIFLPTYNRHNLLQKALFSLFAQTYKNFEVLLYDNGSEPPVDYIEQYGDNRLRYFRQNVNTNVNDLGEDSIRNMSGTHFLFLGDDDVLIPDTLRIVADLLEYNNQIDILQTGFFRFNHDTNKVCDFENQINSFTSNLEIFDSEEAAYFFINSWGIGPATTYKAPRMAHSSGIFISKKLIDKTRKLQGELFVKPFGDIGYVGAILNTNNLYYLDLPLAVIGETKIREMNGSKPGQRQKWNKEVKYLEYTPIKGASFMNMGADAHLKVIYRNTVDKKYDSRLRPYFYFKHLEQVLSDNPWTKKTITDAIECLPYLLWSTVQFPSHKQNAKQFLNLCKSLFSKTKGHSISNRLSKHDNPGKAINEIYFLDITHFAEWIAYNYATKNWSNNVDYKSISK